MKYRLVRLATFPLDANMYDVIAESKKRKRVIGRELLHAEAVALVRNREQRDRRNAQRAIKGRSK